MNYSYPLYNRVEKPCIIGEISIDSYSGEYISNKTNDLTCDGGEGITIAWNTSGKVKSVTGGVSPLDFFYSASGQRQIKAYLTEGGKASDYYIHDAAGNIMAIYTLSDNYSRFQLKEQHIYGSSRLGIYNRNIEIYPSEEVIPLSFTRGLKRYELPNHLGNVNTVISDRKIQFKGGYMADIKSYVDYYPFGYQIPERTWSSSDYRFGFNGQEKDDEIYGEGNSTTAEYWQYDARLGRRWNVDPIQEPWESSYATFANDPLIFTDPLGLDTIHMNKIHEIVKRIPGGGEENVYTVFLDPVSVNASARKKNPYSIGTVFYKAFENNRDNPNLWNNKAKIDWAGVSKSSWMKDFDSGFGTMLNLSMASVGGAGLLGAAGAGGGIGAISGSAVTGFLKTAFLRFMLDAGIQFTVTGFDINKVDWFDAGLSSVLPLNKKYVWLLESGVNAFVDVRLRTGMEFMLNPVKFPQVFGSNLFFRGAFKANYNFNLSPMISNQFRYGDSFNQGFNSAIDAANSATNEYLIEK